MRAGLLGVWLSIALGAPGAKAGEGEHSRARLELHSASGTESCITKGELEVAVERRLRRKVFEEPAELLVEVRVARTENAWTAELVLFDAERHELGRRALDTAAKDCSALDASLALVLALLVDSPPEPPAPPPEAPTPLPSPPERSRTTPIELPKDTFAPREPFHFVPTVSLSGAVNRLPGFAFGPRLGIAFLPPHFPEFRLSVGALLPRDVKKESEKFGGRFSLLDALVELCPLALSTASLRLSGCVGQSIGRLTVTGFGFDRNDEEPGLDLVLTAGVDSWIFVVRPVGVRIGLGAGFPLSRNTYSARTADGGRLEVWQRGYVVGSGELGVGIEL